MAVSLKEYVEESGVIEEVEEELAGIKNLNWDVTNYDDNLKAIDHIVHTFFVHISEHLNRINELEKEIKETEELTRKESGETTKTDPWYQLYESQKTILDGWLRVVGYLALQLDVLDKVKNSLAGLLKEARTYGVLKQKVETELEVLKEIKQSYIDSLTKSREHMFEVDKRVSELLNSLVAQQKVDLTPLTSKIEMLEKKISDLEEKAKEEKYEVSEYEEEKILPERTLPEKKVLKGLELTKAIESLVRDEGITDRLEIAKRLGVSPMAVSLAGYKNIVEKYSKTSEEEETEEEENVEEEGGEENESEG
jgi:polyhydroxyalkanoate synthesis regulator phasin